MTNTVALPQLFPLVPFEIGGAAIRVGIITIDIDMDRFKGAAGHYITYQNIATLLTDQIYKHSFDKTKNGYRLNFYVTEEFKNLLMHFNTSYATSDSIKAIGEVLNLCRTEKYDVAFNVGDVIVDFLDYQLPTTFRWIKHLNENGLVLKFIAAHLFTNGVTAYTIPHPNGDAYRTVESVTFSNQYMRHAYGQLLQSEKELIHQIVREYLDLRDKHESLHQQLKNLAGSDFKLH